MKSLKAKNAMNLMVLPQFIKPPPLSERSGGELENSENDFFPQWYLFR